MKFLIQVKAYYQLIVHEAAFASLRVIRSYPKVDELAILLVRLVVVRNIILSIRKHKATPSP